GRERRSVRIAGATDGGGFGAAVVVCWIEAVCLLPPPQPASSATAPTSVALRIQERIAVVPRRREGLLDGARAHPADEVPHRAGLVVRAGRARAAERLLPDDGPRRLVVHVEVAGRVAKPVLRLLNRLAVLREDGAGEAVRRGLVDQLERLVPAVL